MKMVEIKCPSCGGKLKVEDSQTKLITCEFCKSQFLLDDEKVQNITNYNIYQTAPSGKGQGNGAKTALAAGVACVGALLAIFILSSGSGSSSGPGTAPLPVPAYSGAAGYAGTEGEETEAEERVPKADSPLFHAMAHPGKQTGYGTALRTLTAGKSPWCRLPSSGPWTGSPRMQRPLPDW